MKTSQTDILYKALDEVFEKHQSLCLDDASERALLKGLIIGTFFILQKEDEDSNNENS